MLTTNYARPEDTYAAAQRRATIRKAQAAAAAIRGRARLRDTECDVNNLPFAEMVAATLETERRQEAAKNRVRIAHVVSKFSEGNRAAMRAESSTYLPGGRAESARKKAASKKAAPSRTAPRTR